MITVRQCHYQEFFLVLYLFGLCRYERNILLCQHFVNSTKNRIETSEINLKINGIAPANRTFPKRDRFTPDRVVNQGTGTLINFVCSVFSQSSGSGIYLSQQSVF